MRTQRLVPVLGLCLLTAAACTAQRSTEAADQTTSSAQTTERVSTTRPSSTLEEPSTTDAAPPQSRPSTTTSQPTTTSTTSSTIVTTTSEPVPTVPVPAGVFDPACARVVQPGDSLSVIADGFDDPTVTASSLQTENAIVDANLLQVGALLDVCPGNGLDDLTGATRLPAAPTEQSGGVAAQQRKLNELFAGTGLPALAVDGISGPFTRQQLCAARMALNLTINRTDMQPGSPEEQTLMAATSISVPANAVVSASRWILIDKTCQVMFAGDGGGLTFVFKTSTGEPGWETRNQEGVQPFRYNPALHNNGWHNSSRFPVAEDNPLNGNMYKPIYFHRGQAIHGANNVPPEPASKGCARLRVENQDALIAWLGLGDVTEEIYDSDRINAIVTVQGEFG